MSNDLISREVLLEKAEEWCGSQTYLISEEVWKIIKNFPKAFDKENVIEELIELRQKEYSDSDEESELSDGEEIYDKGRSQGRFEAYHRATKIVEKGGIE